jgi:hypothetical protein
MYAIFKASPWFTDASGQKKKYQASADPQFVDDWIRETDTYKVSVGRGLVVEILNPGPKPAAAVIELQGAENQGLPIKAAQAEESPFDLTDAQPAEQAASAKKKGKK